MQASARRVWHGTLCQEPSRLFTGHTLCDPPVFGKHRLPQSEYLRAIGAEWQEVEEPHGKPLRPIQYPKCMNAAVPRIGFPVRAHYGCVCWVLAWVFGPWYPLRGAGWGGSTTGSAHPAAGGAVGPHGLSPDAAGRVASVVAAGHCATGFLFFGVGSRACALFLGIGPKLSASNCSMKNEQNQ